MSPLTWAKDIFHVIDELLSYQVREQCHVAHLLWLVTGDGVEVFTLVCLMEHVTNADGCHGDISVTQGPEIEVIITGVMASICDDHCKHPSLLAPALLDELIVGELEGRGRPGATSNPLEVFDSLLETGQGVDSFVVQPDGLKSALVAVLHHTHTCAYKGTKVGTVSTSLFSHLGDLGLATLNEITGEAMILARGRDLVSALGSFMAFTDLSQTWGPSQWRPAC